MNARVSIAIVLLLIAELARAGAKCRDVPVGASELARATDAALATQRALDARDEPVALVARVGQDLSRFGLEYSHVAFVLRDHPDGRWTVVHLLNRCGTDSSGIYSEGLVNFYLDDLIDERTAIVWLEPALARRVAEARAGDGPRALHNRHYSAIARPESMQYQNSTSWLLEIVELAMHGDKPADGRARAHQLLAQDRFQPDVLRIPYIERLAGAVTVANVSFVDHPLGDRLSGHYRVVTVDSIFRYLAQQHVVAGRVDFDAARAAGPRS